MVIYRFMSIAYQRSVSFLWWIMIVVSVEFFKKKLLKFNMQEIIIEVILYLSIVILIRLQIIKMSVISKMLLM